MRFLLLGEGASDLGRTGDSPGPLVVPIKRLAALVTDEVLECDHIGKSQLGDYASTKRSDNQRKLLLRGNKRKTAGLASVQRYAAALAQRAVAQTEACGAVYFADCDYTNSEVTDSKRYYEDLIRAMEYGFYSVAGFKEGVPMVPKPRSESWFLCHYDCAHLTGSYFEDLPANDAAENSGKRRLGKVLKCAPVVSEIYARLDAEVVDWEHLPAPSFQLFKRRFMHVVERLAHISTSVSEEKTLMAKEVLV